ncbi:RluA family pseudouridine synthase [Leptolyngbya sp. PCC 6406]|uniref:RluA family pseudouridine synthase n=1 Tax=Leptolyngbya sp. PCC 6406 TaxID=1173264 RepID=UPI0002AD18EF|nr:RluA family pseudouridine synthase [Leptolyngbya sp. PCC 6406]
MNQGWTYYNQVQASDAGLTLLDYYSQRYPHSSRGEWCDRIQSGQVEVDGRQGSEEAILKPRQRLAYHRPPWEEPPAPLNFGVLYEDGDLLVVDKPAGLPVLPGGGFLNHTLLHQLRQHYPQETPVPIHRLGRGTSGLLLLGRSSLAKSVLSQQMRASTEGHSTTGLEKCYRALIGPSTLPDTLTLTTPIGKLPHPTLGYVYGASAMGKTAHSQVRVVQRTTTQTLIEVIIRTGRPHQIRIHLAAAGYPLLGDPLYQVGGIPRSLDVMGKMEAVPGDCGYHLHAHRLTFRHPRTQALVTLTAPLPPTLWG